MWNMEVGILYISYDKQVEANCLPYAAGKSVLFPHPPELTLWPLNTKTIRWQLEKGE